MSSIYQDFQVGKKVWVEKTSYDSPRWDFSTDEGEGDGEWMVGEIKEVKPSQREACVVFDNEEINEWWMPLPGHKDWDDSRPGWYSLSDPKSIEEENVQIIFAEVLGKPRIGNQIPQKVLDDALDRGERRVRRLGREWPYGKSLKHRLSPKPDGNVHLEFFWVDER